MDTWLAIERWSVLTVLWCGIALSFYICDSILFLRLVRAVLRGGGGCAVGWGGGGESGETLYDRLLTHEITFGKLIESVRPQKNIIILALVYTIEIYTLLIHTYHGEESEVKDVERKDHFADHRGPIQYAVPGRDS